MGHDRRKGGLKSAQNDPRRRAETYCPVAPVGHAATTKGPRVVFSVARCRIRAGWRLTLRRFLPALADHIKTLIRTGNPGTKTARVGGIGVDASQCGFFRKLAELEHIGWHLRELLLASRLRAASQKAESTLREMHRVRMQDRPRNGATSFNNAMRPPALFTLSQPTVNTE